MKISVKVKPNAKTALVEKLTNTEYVVRVKAPAKEGKANDAVVEALSDHFGIAKSRITIVKGLGSKSKLVEIS